MLLRHLMTMEKVFLIVKSKEIFNHFFFLKILLFSSLRELLTAVGNPAERLSDVEVINKNLSILFNFIFIKLV